MDENVKVEDTIEVPLSIISDPTCSVLHSNKVEDELFCADLNIEVKHEDFSIQSSDHQIKFEAPDADFGTVSGSDGNYMKLEPLECKELQIKDEIDQSPTDETTEESPQFEYFYCHICNCKLTLKSSLRQHMKIHTGDKPFKCTVCDYKCIRKADLLRHIKTHTGEKPFKCGSCNYRSITKANISRHIKSHMGNKPFKCPICDYRFIDRSTLLVHIKTHTLEKLFKCSICGYRCTQKTELLNHIKTHKGRNHLNAAYVVIDL